MPLPFISFWLNYEFIGYEPQRAWEAMPGIYIFAKQSSPKEWEALYIGSAESLADRLSDHSKWPEAERLGTTHIHARIVWDKNDRQNLEQELIRCCQPPLNIQHR